ncbi:unnamed protein product, partial [Phaeothamnion confervicola]
VVNGQATFLFAQPVAGALRLCYRHGDSPWRLYDDVTVTTVNSGSGGSGGGTSADTTNLGSALCSSSYTADAADPGAGGGMTQRTTATVDLTVDGAFAAMSDGSVARTSFVEEFSEAVAAALAIPTSRVVVKNLSPAGRLSTVVRFSLPPSGSTADPTVHELVAALHRQRGTATAAAPLSATAAAVPLLRTARSMSAGTTVVPPTVPSPPLFEVTTVATARPRGTFRFERPVYHIAEAAGTVSLTVVREQGLESAVDIMYRTAAADRAGMSAAARMATTRDAASSSDTDVGVLHFRPGETSKTLVVTILDDSLREAHYETFAVELTGLGTSPVGAGLSDPSSATVRIYDYGEGPVLARADFAAAARAESVGDSWTVIGNGGVPGWLGPDGFGAADAVFGPNEYSFGCDYAAQAPCNHSCPFGLPYAESGAAPAVLRLSASGFVAAAGPIANFPSTEITVSLWIRADIHTAASESASSTNGGGNGAPILSYAFPGALADEYELLLHRPECLTLLLQQKLVSAAARYDGAGGGDLDGYAAGADVTSGGDGSGWHHVAVAWRAADGRVAAYIDGARVFDGGPYRVGAALRPGGSLVLGQ